MVWVFIMNRMSSQSSSSSQRRRMALGIVILLLVDVIWVASSELTSVSIAACILNESYLRGKAQREYSLSHSVGLNLFTFFSVRGRQWPLVTEVTCVCYKL